MKELIKRILNEEQETPVLNKKEILLFKYINDNKQESKTKKELIKFIGEMLRYFGMPLNEATMYYETYTANFRPGGDYENLTKDNFKDYRQFKQRKVTNNTAYEYATAKMPFKGSNVEGQWDVNNKNEWYYVITSYEWYPIFLFINNQWYRTLETYSNSTAKQMNHVNPVRYDSGLQEDVKVVTKYEMERIMDGSYNFDDVKTRRVTDFVRGKDNVIGTKKLISGGYGDTAHRVSFTITDIDEVDDKIKIFVKVNKAGRMDGRKMVADPNYQNNPQLVSDIENTIKQDILRTHPKYLMDGNTEIEIIH
jgi:hypothetical protein